MFAWRLRNFLYASSSVILCLLFAVGIRMGSVCKLSSLKGERCFFLDSESSQGLRKTELNFSELWRVKGECVFFPISEYEGGRYALNASSREALAKRIASEYDAEILWKEEACGRVSYYGYSARLSGGILLFGKTVNLHIAVGETECGVGTPIIFDGF